MTVVTFLTARNTKNALFFIRCDSHHSTAGGCFPQRPLSATNRTQLCEAGGFAEPFSPPLRDLLWPRRSSLWSRPAKGCSPFDPRQGAPCTCPAPPFTAKPGLCFTRRLAVEKSMPSTLFGDRAFRKKKRAHRCPLTFFLASFFFDRKKEGSAVSRRRSRRTRHCLVFLA